jgi:N-ethylmaleimide reductase
VNPTESAAAGLLEPFKLGPHRLRNRMVMSPMTRNRSGAAGVPTALAASYYEQRASAGLIVTEATRVSFQGVGYFGTPGIHTREQVAGWRRVTDAVHGRGGRIFVQLWHVGRNGFETPGSLGRSAIAAVVRQFAGAAREALAAGFDGVELHAANGYLIDQFLRDGSNPRTDAYGGSAEGRARFLLEVTEAAAGVWGSERVGVRLSPTSAFNGMSDSDPETTFGFAAGALSSFGLAYLHVVAPGALDPSRPEHRIVHLVRHGFGGPIVLNAGLDREEAGAALALGLADLVSFGIFFLPSTGLAADLALDRPTA